MTQHFVSMLRRCSPRHLSVGALFVASVWLWPQISHAALQMHGEKSVSFVAVGPAGLTFKGASTQIAVAEDADHVSFTVPVATLDTGIGLRTQHMRDTYLEAARYPNATLVFQKSAVTLRAGKGKVTGTLSLHGQSHPVAVNYELKSAASGFEAHASFELDMREFGIAVPKYLGVSVKPNVSVEANLALAER